MSRPEQLSGRERRLIEQAEADRDRDVLDDWVADRRADREAGTRWAS